MRNGGGSSSNGRGNGVSSIPAASKKMVQSLKEIVNRPDDEIYAMLKECNMDPNDAVNRLLSQDTFHEVKSKREKKKEVKENTESRSRVVGGMSNWGRGSADRDVGRGSSTKFNYSESGVLRGKAVYKKDNGAHAVPNSSCESGVPANDVYHNSISQSNPISTETTIQEMGTSDRISLSSRPSSGFQPAWLGAPGHVSMADIVKMGRPHATTSNIQTTATSHSSHNAIMSNMSSQKSAKNHLHPTFSPSDSYRDIHSSQYPASKISDIIHDTSLAVNQHISSGDWPVIEKSQAASGPSVAEPSNSSVTYLDPSSSLYADRINSHPTESDEIHVIEGTVSVENQMPDSIGSAATSDRQMQVDNAGGSSHFDGNSFRNNYSYKSPSPVFDRQEAIPNHPDPSSVEDVNEALSSAAGSLQQLSLQEEVSAQPAGEKPAVIIPNHLQVPSSDFSNLSFGSFVSGVGAGFSGSFVPKTLKSNLGEVSRAADGSSVEHLESGDCETSNDNVVPPSSSQAEVQKHDAAMEVTHGHQYHFPLSGPGYAIESTTQSNAEYSYSQTNSQMQNLASFSSVMQASANSLPSNLSAPTVQQAQESDFPYSQFTATQSIATKYSSGMSSISGPTITVPEAVKSSIFPTSQPTLQTLASSTIPAGSALPQHLAMHPYSQPALFANMMTYPFLPQSYAYMPSAFQQAYAANSVYHQSPATVQNSGMKYSLPQYKNSIPASSLPQPAAIASGYGGVGSSTNFPGSFLNPSTTPSSTAIGYEEVMSTQYKDSNHYGSQQNEASTMWVNGSGSRTMSALPGSTYYGFQGQNQHGVMRQSQQHSHYGALGYPNFYHSQTGVPQEHQHTPNDGALNASQGPPSQQSHQIWQRSY